MCEFYAYSPPNTPHTGASSCKEHFRAGWGGLYSPVGSVCSTCPKGKERESAHCRAPAPSPPPPPQRRQPLKFLPPSPLPMPPPIPLSLPLTPPPLPLLLPLPLPPLPAGLHPTRRSTSPPRKDWSHLAPHKSPRVLVQAKRGRWTMGPIRPPTIMQPHTC